MYETLEMLLSYRGVRPKERAAAVAETLDRFRIVDKKDLYPSQLADDPTGNLHSAQVEAIMELFTRLNREGTTIVQVTYSEKNASYGSRTIQLRDGWIVSAERAGVSAVSRKR